MGQQARRQAFDIQEENGGGRLTKMVAEIPPIPPPPRTQPCACGCDRPCPTTGPHKRDYFNGACRARASRQRKKLGTQPGKVTRCQVVKHGEVSLTLRLPHTWQHRMHELVPGAWVDVVPHRRDE